MLFHEIYGRYYQVLAKVLREACRGTLTREKLYGLIQEGSFGESTLELPRILAESHLLTREGKTPLASVPDCPLTALERHWLLSSRILGCSCSSRRLCRSLWENRCFPGISSSIMTDTRMGIPMGTRSIGIIFASF